MDTGQYLSLPPRLQSRSRPATVSQAHSRFTLLPAPINTHAPRHHLAIQTPNSQPFLPQVSILLKKKNKKQDSAMGTRLPQVAALLAALLAVSFGAAAWKAEAAAAPPVVVGSIKCLDCSPNGVNAEDTLQGRCKLPLLAVADLLFSVSPVDGHEN